MVRSKRERKWCLIIQFFPGDGFVGLEEYRYDCVNRQAVASIDDIDKAFDRISESGGVTRTRYQQLFAQYLGDTNKDASFLVLF